MVKLKSIDGAMIKEEINTNPRAKKLPPWWNGFNSGRNQQGEVDLTLNREKLAIFLSQQKGWKGIRVLPDGAGMLADAIIANLPGLIEVKK